MNVRLRFFAMLLAFAAASSVAFSCSTPPPPKPAAPPQAVPPTPAPSPVPTPTPRPWPYPAAAKGDVVDDYHGTKVADPYRWMDKADDPATTSWVAAENALTRKVLDGPARETIKARLTVLVNYPRVSIPYHRGRYYFFSKNTGLQNQSVN